MKTPTIAELYLAYRQAKAALYFERRGVGLLGLAEYEEKLPLKLATLHKKLAAGSSWFDDIDPGEVFLVPKRLRTAPTASTEQNKVVHLGGAGADPARRGIDVQLRLTPNPEFAILEVLYLRAFGVALDSLLSTDVVGYRLDKRGGTLGPTRRWLFEYWPNRYREFRNAPLEAASKALRGEGRSVLVVSADLASYYDTVHPCFMLDEGFVAQMAQTPSMPSEFLEGFDIEAYRIATASLLGAYDRYRAQASRRTGLSVSVGVPIGALTSRLVANVALCTLDARIASRSDVLCYRRYVDDLVIVANSCENPMGFEDILRRLIPLKSTDDPLHLDSVGPNDRHQVASPRTTNVDTFELDVDALERPLSEFRLQRQKIRIHALSGVPGQDFVEAVAADFQRIVSERRAFLDTSVLLDNGAARLIRAGQEGGAPLRVLRDADKARLEQFALSTSLQSLERVSSLVDQDQARVPVRRTLERVGRVLDSEDDWVENLDVMLRLFKLAIKTKDEQSCSELNERMDRVWGTSEALRASTEGLFFRGQPIDPSRERPWTWLRNYVHERRLEAVCAALPLDASVPETGGWLHSGLVWRTQRLKTVALRHRANELAASDLRASDREDDATPQRKPENLDAHWMESLLESDDVLRERLTLIGTFIERCQRLNDAPWRMPPARLFLCTRPPSYFDVARRWLYRVEAEGFTPTTFDELLQIVNAIRGTRYQDPVGRRVHGDTVAIAEGWQGRLPDDERPPNPKLILGNVVVSERHWQRAATRVAGSQFGNPLLNMERLIGLANVLAKAGRVASTSTDSVRAPALLVLPELSLPRQWFRSVANHVVKNERFGFVAGLEYRHDLKNPYVMNQVVAVLPGPFGSVATWPWTKRVAARDEEANLAAQNPPVSFRPIHPSDLRRRRAVVLSPWGRFSVLICSELIEARRVADLLGRVELVLCPAWNTDTAAYDHLISSTGLQLHAIVAVANNGHFSDCRAWAPYAERWQRDLCRLIERDIDDVVHVELPLSELRSFQASGGRPGIVPSCPPDCASRRPPWRPLPPDWPIYGGTSIPNDDEAPRP